MKEHTMTKLDVYELQNRMLNKQDAWCSTGNEDARDRLFWWQGVVDTIAELLELFEDEVTDEDEITDAE